MGSLTTNVDAEKTLACPSIATSHAATRLKTSAVPSRWSGDPSFRFDCESRERPRGDERRVERREVEWGDSRVICQTSRATNVERASSRNGFWHPPKRLIHGMRTPNW